jgi:hypothetical protein
MTFNGGTLLFSDGVIQNELTISELIQNILTDSETYIEVISVTGEEGSVIFTGIFKIIAYNKTFSSNFKSDPPDTIYAPSVVLLIKLFINNPDTDVDNEIAIQKELGSQTNIMPICPSFLFSERIQTPGQEMTMLGQKFYRLFEKAHGPYSEFCTLIQKEDPKNSAYIQDILIMEFIECQTYFNFYEYTMISVAGKKITKDSFYKYITLTIEITLSGLNHGEELQNFYTYYMASLLAIKGYHHADIHSKNIMICPVIEENDSKQPDKQLSIERTNIFPFVIDFGRAGRITQEELKFIPLKTTLDVKKKLALATKKKLWGEILQYLSPIYLNALTNMTTIADYVKSLLAKENYVDAVLTLSMCINPKLRGFTSMFVGFYEFSHEPYAYLYFINEERKKKYNSMIGQLIESRKQLESTLTQQVDGGKLVLRRQKKAKTKKAKKSKKSKTKKSKKAKTN